jgi:hypothetical protein
VVLEPDTHDDLAAVDAGDASEADVAVGIGPPHKIDLSLSTLDLLSS